MSRRIWVPAIVALVLVIAVAGAVFAQTATPGQAPNATPSTPSQGNALGPGGFFGFGGRNGTIVYDAVAKALNLTPQQLFDQLHSGQTLAQIAQAQGVQMSAVQQAAQAARAQAFKDAINQAVQSGRITQDHANWLLQGLQNGWLGGNGAGFGFGGPNNMMPRNGMRVPRGNGNGSGQQPSPQPTTTPNA